MIQTYRGEPLISGAYKKDQRQRDYIKDQPRSRGPIINSDADSDSNISDHDDCDNYNTIHLQTDATACVECGSGFSKHAPIRDILLFTKDGPVAGKHKIFSCKKKICRRTHGYGYTSKQHVRQYDKDCLQKDYLLTSRASGIQMEKLHESVLQLVICHNNFEGQAEVYNHVHAEIDEEKLFREGEDDENLVPLTKVGKKEETRTSFHSKILANACYSYMLLDFDRRYNIGLKYGTTLEETIENNLENIRNNFEVVWTEHCCDNEEIGCSKKNRCLVCDGGWKLTRKICYARWAGVRRFQTSKAEVLSGCDRIPIPGRKFCHLHDNNTPSVSGSCLSVQTQEQLGIKKRKGND